MCTYITLLTSSNVQKSYGFVYMYLLYTFVCARFNPCCLHTKLSEIPKLTCRFRRCAFHSKTQETVSIDSSLWFPILSLSASVDVQWEANSSEFNLCSQSIDQLPAQRSKLSLVKRKFTNCIGCWMGTSRK